MSHSTKIQVNLLKLGISTMWSTFWHLVYLP